MADFQDKLLRLLATRQLGPGHLHPIGVGQQSLDVKGGIGLARHAGRIQVQGHPGMTHVLVQLGVDEPVAQTRLGPTQDVDIAEDATHAELVLVLQIAAVAPLEHQNGQLVVARPQVVGHIELAGGVRDLAVADQIPVDPEVEAGIHTLEIEQGPGR